MKRSDYKGFIFDFNGTLLWDDRFHDQAWLEFARMHIGPSVDLESMIETIHGRTNGFILRFLLDRELTKDEIARYADEKESAYQRLCLSHPDEFRLAPGAIELLDTIAQAGIPRTIATASQKYNVDFFIENLRLAKWFDTKNIVFDDGSFPGKPAPDMYLIAAERIGIAPHDCIVFEDSRSGIAAARKAGIGKIIYVRSTVSNRSLDYYPSISDFREIDLDRVMLAD